MTYTGLGRFYGFRGRLITRNLRLNLSSDANAHCGYFYAVIMATVKGPLLIKCTSRYTRSTSANLMFATPQSLRPTYRINPPGNLMAYGTFAVGKYSITVDYRLRWQTVLCNFRQSQIVILDARRLIRLAKVCNCDIIGPSVITETPKAKSSPTARTFTRKFHTTVKIAG